MEDAATKKLRQFGIDFCAVSHVLDTSTLDSHGLAEGFVLRRHNDFDESDKALDQCRAEWASYVCPPGAWGNTCPTVGNLVALGISLSLPDRLCLSAYIWEYAFLYDDLMEISEKSTLDEYTENLCLNKIQNQTAESVSGAKQIQSKILLEMTKKDPLCTEVVINTWKEMVTIVMGIDRKNRVFDNFDDYIESRILDVGCVFSGALMLFSIGVVLTDDQHKLATDILRPCWAALALTNDYFSFDKEYEEFLQSDESMMVNCVWLYMQWDNLPVQEAKDKLRKQIVELERDFLAKREAFSKFCTQESSDLLHYIQVWYHSLAANAYWSRYCPRYNAPKPIQEPAVVSGTEVLSMPKRENNSTDQNTLTTSSTSTVGTSIIRDKGTNQIETATHQITKWPVSYLESGETISRKAQLDTKHLLTPYEYLTSMPSKGVREAFVDALNLWFSVPDETLEKIKEIGGILHTASIMLDDIEDDSPLRRGKDAAHIVYGQAQVINSSNYLIVWATEEIYKLGNLACLGAFFEEIRNSLIGQSYEMEWRDQILCPTESEYVEMIEKKTGALFRFLARLMVALSRRNSDLNLDRLAYKIGQYFQIRDDVMNLTDTTYTNQKGFCEDLDEGKFSYLVVHAWNNGSTEDRNRLRSIFQEGRRNNGLSREAKEEVLENLHKAGSFEYADKKLNHLQQDIDAEVAMLENKTRWDNWSLQFLLHKLYTK
ncbi:Dimethylallyltranstransferase [Dactylellina cionopaga]|nr:Dimethylallyltranstransferase [Dactylellina cionopaga]